MGMLMNGQWSATDDREIVAGAYHREQSTFDNAIADEVIHRMAGHSRRFILVASMSCPWSHRVLLVRAIKGLEYHVPLHVAGGNRIEGYGMHPAGPLRLDGATPLHVHRLYTESHPGFTGRVTVPLLWDDSNSLIVSNDSALIMRALDRIDQRRFSLVPGHLVDRIDSLNAYIHTGLANAVYRAGLAQAQSAHDEAIADVFATLAALEKRLSRSRYLLGDAMCEADLRLFATLVRFDAVYVTHFRCTRHRLTDYPNLWAYARDIYAWPGVSATVSFDAILDGYYRNDGWHNPHGIIPERPAADWTIPSGRSRVGPACFWTADGQLLSAPIEDDQ